MLPAAVLCSLFMLPSLAGAASQAGSSAAPAAASATAAPVSGAAAAPVYDLTFQPAKGLKETQSLEGRQVSYYAYRDLVYVTQPKNVDYEKMNVFIPAAYLEGKSVNGYTARTAPIFLPNQVGGYMPGKAGDPAEKNLMGGGTSTLLKALDRGYVVASPAIRGRTTTDANGTYVGKAPALIVDYKAAVRYLRHNQKALPAGDTEKIISSGTSAGGALSALLGATGDSTDYEPYLREIGLPMNGTTSLLRWITAPSQTSPTRTLPMNGSLTASIRPTSGRACRCPRCRQTERLRKPRPEQPADVRSTRLRKL